jgi:hypothetical protein
MNLDYCLRHLRANADSVASLAAGLSPEQARFRPDESSWSTVEVICHLRDEERQDFRVLIDRIARPDAAPEHAIDPAAWVTSRRYQEQDLQRALGDFLQARAESLGWLSGLGDLIWNATLLKPWGEISAGEALAAWVAHDLLHLRQLIEIRYALTQASLAPYGLGYAGDW